MTINEARMNLFLMGWKQSVEVPLYWERWCREDHNAYFRLELIGTEKYVGRFADGFLRTIDDVTTYAGIVQLALNIQENS